MGQRLNGLREHIVREEMNSYLWCLNYDQRSTKQNPFMSGNAFLRIGSHQENTIHFDIKLHF